MRHPRISTLFPFRRYRMEAEITVGIHETPVFYIYDAWENLEIELVRIEDGHGLTLGLVAQFEAERWWDVHGLFFASDRHVEDLAYGSA